MYGIKAFEITKISKNDSQNTPDLVVLEEPLEIRLGFGEAHNRQQKSLAVTMRTPTKHDFDLALGFLFTEGIIQSISAILSIHYCTDLGNQTQQNIVRVELQPNVEFDLEKLNRNFYATSSCGICGKASIEAIEQICTISNRKKLQITAQQILQLPQILKENQLFFQHTGGLHAAMFFSLADNKTIAREDIGRHNALDKLIGAALQANQLPLDNHILLMSSRASFELLQKAAMAGIAVVACMSAPSSLAIETAQKFNITLIGFLRENSFNIYSFSEQIIY